MDETHGWSNHETGSLIDLWGEDSTEQAFPLPPLTSSRKGTIPIYPDLNKENHKQTTNIYCVKNIYIHFFNN